MRDVFKNPRYRGKHVILVEGKVYTAKTGVEVARLWKKVEKEHPRSLPEYTFLPKGILTVLCKWK